MSIIEQFYEEHKKHGLEAICTKLGISKQGTVRNLQARLHDHDAAQVKKAIAWFQSSPNDSRTVGAPSDKNKLQRAKDWFCNQPLFVAIALIFFALVPTAALTPLWPGVRDMLARSSDAETAELISQNVEESLKNAGWKLVNDEHHNHLLVSAQQDASNWDTLIEFIEGLECDVALDLTAVSNRFSMDKVWDLKRLVGLHIRDIESPITATELGRLPNLKSLSLLNCAEVSTLFATGPSPIAGLKHLDLTGSGHAFDRLSEIGVLPNLEELSVGKHTGVIDLKGIRNLRQLKIFTATDCQFKSVNLLSQHPMLQTLYFTNVAFEGELLGFDAPEQRGQVNVYSR